MIPTHSNRATGKLFFRGKLLQASSSSELQRTFFSGKRKDKAHFARTTKRLLSTAANPSDNKGRQKSKIQMMKGNTKQSLELLKKVTNSNEMFKTMSTNETLFENISLENLNVQCKI